MNIKHIAAGITAAVIMGAMSITAFAAQKESPLQMAAIAIDDSLSTAWGENRNVSYTEDENKIYIIIWDDGVNEKTIENEISELQKTRALTESSPMVFTNDRSTSWYML